MRTPILSSRVQELISVSVNSLTTFSQLRRDEYFVVTKLNPALHGYQSAKDNLKCSLERLGLEYVDLYLIHSPGNGKNLETWKGKR